ncbi:MAG: hypothetical protein WA051_02645 [Minisyncoccia bacterium]
MKKALRTLIGLVGVLAIGWAAVKIVFVSGDTFGDPAVYNGVGLALLFTSAICIIIAVLQISNVNDNAEMRRNGWTPRGTRLGDFLRLVLAGVMLSVPVIVIGATMLDNGREARKVNETESTGTTDFLRVMVLNVDLAGQMVLLPISYDRKTYGVHPEYFWDRTFVCHQPIVLKTKTIPEFAKTRNAVVVVSVTSTSQFSNRDCFGWPPRAMSLHELVVTKKDIDIALREAKLQ